MSKSMRNADMLRQLFADMTHSGSYPAQMADPTNDTKVLGARIKQARESASLSQEEFGNRLAAFGHRAASKQTISSWETGRNIPSAIVLRDIARVCNVSTDSLTLGVDRWPFETQLLEKIRQLDPRQLLKLEGAIEMWLTENIKTGNTDNRGSLEQAA